MPATARRCAARLISTTPLIVHFIRRHTRSAPPNAPSIPQFRLLEFLNRHDAVTLTTAAAQLGFTLPGLSRMVKSLVARGLLARQGSSPDRRRISLRLTPVGKEAMRQAQQDTQAHLVQKLLRFTPGELVVIDHALRLLQHAFAPAHVRGSPPGI